MIDVAHDGNDGSTPDQVLLLFGQLDFLRRFLFEADLVCRSAEIARDLFCQLYVERLVDGGKNLLFHQLLDNQVGFDSEFFG